MTEGSSVRLSGGDARGEQDARDGTDHAPKGKDPDPHPDDFYAGQTRRFGAGGGVILNIASTHAFTIIPHTFPCPLAKHALLGMTKSLGLSAFALCESGCQLGTGSRRRTD
jgi:NAD(P)-dependent dehydrogenase (short-subunit alcohol dehydrogenase family)